MIIFILYYLIQMEINPKVEEFDSRLIRHLSREISKLDLPFHFSLSIVIDDESGEKLTPVVVKSQLDSNFSFKKIDPQEGIVIELDFEVLENFALKDPKHHWVNSIYIYLPPDYPFRAPTVYFGADQELNHPRIVDVDGRLDLKDWSIAITFNNLICDIYSVYLESR